MKKLTFIDYPKFVPRAEYDKAIDKMVEKLKRIPGIVSLYQIGSINDPGISDIDLVAVFEDKISCNIDPRDNLSRIEKYLFIHNLFGLSSPYFNKSQKYSLFHGYNLLYGRDLRNNKMSISAEEKKILQQQIALEYLIKMYQTLSIQITYKIIKLRSILLEVKALQYDLEFLNIKDEKLVELINEFINMRTKWFSEKYDEKFLENIIFDLYKELENFLRNKLISENEGFFFEIAQEYYSSRNVSFIIRRNFGFEHSGFTLPRFPVKLFGARYFNLNSRFNKFIFFLPIINVNMKKILKKKLVFERKSSEYNLKYFSFFSPLKTSLNILKSS